LIWITQGGADALNVAIGHGEGLNRKLIGLATISALFGTHKTRTRLARSQFLRVISENHADDQPNRACSGYQRLAFIQKASLRTIWF
jgi:hypothetical protein